MLFSSLPLTCLALLLTLSDSIIILIFVVNFDHYRIFAYFDLFTNIQTDVGLAGTGSTDAYAPGRTGSGSSNNLQPPQPSHHDTGSFGGHNGSSKGLTGTTGATVATGGHPLSGTSTRHRGTIGAGGSGNVGGGGGSVSLVGGGRGSGSMGDRHGSSSKSRGRNRGGSRIPNNGTSGSGSGKDLEAGEGEILDGEFVTSPIGISSFGAPSVDNFGCDV